MAGMALKRALSPTASCEDAECSKRARQECSMEETMEVDERESMEEDEQHVLYGEVSRDGNQWLDPNDSCYAITSPPLQSTTVDQTMAEDMVEQSVAPDNVAYASGHYGCHPLSSLPQSHPLRTQLSVQSVMTFASESSYDSGPQTPLDDPIELYDEDTEQPCYAFGKDSRGVSLPFFRIGHA